MGGIQNFGVAASTVDLDNICGGVISVWNGQCAAFGGGSSCSPYTDMLLNAFAFIYYSKVAFRGTVSCEDGLVILPQAHDAFSYRQGGAGGGGFPGPITADLTNYTEAEDPVCQGGELLLCVVGQGVEIERPYAIHMTDGNPSIGTGDHDYITALQTQFPDLADTARAALLVNVTKGLIVGNQRCEYFLGLLVHYPSSYHVASNGTKNGEFGYALGFTPFNSIVAVSSLRDCRRVLERLTLWHTLTFASGSVALPEVPAEVIFPIRLDWFTFICRLPSPADLLIGRPGPGLPYPGYPMPGQQPMPSQDPPIPTPPAGGLYRRNY